ncbi:DUF402 domain-containing protein [Glycomyces paridis]|uniref:DUF402 domain-containing protein n=1 Tax=Glycomyces paridis TaxID=2126555 RepID=A0A4S8PJB3_9ACTN|nr:DUF402 domain-containing protein [Glycomyces paridis]THV30778.1 DUF402 domain-containing protein [Glycomyces paridis]
MSFQPGQTILRRDVGRDGRIAAVVSVRVVSDDERGVLTWTAEGSEVMWRTTLAGERVRKFSANDLAATPTMLSPSAWTGTNVLWLTPPGAAHTVGWFFGADGFFGWYVNLETPSRRWSGGLDTTDLALDVWATPDGAWNWKDEDEFAERTGRPEYWTAGEADAIRAEGERAIALIEARDHPFDGSLTDFAPDPAWGPTALPPGWDRPLQE